MEILLNVICLIYWQSSHHTTGICMQKVLQFLEAFTDLRRIVLVGLSIGLVELIQHGLAVTITGVNWMCLDRKPQTVITTNRKPMVMGVIER